MRNWFLGTAIRNSAFSLVDSVGMLAPRGWGAGPPGAPPLTAS